MSFTAVVGKELIELAEKSGLDEEERTILSTYIHPSEDEADADMKPVETSFSDEKKADASNDTEQQSENIDDEGSVDSDKAASPTQSRKEEKPKEKDAEQDTVSVQSLNSTNDPDEVRNRFSETYSRFESNSSWTFQENRGFNLIHLIQGVKCVTVCIQEKAKNWSITKNPLKKDCTLS